MSNCDTWGILEGDLAIPTGDKAIILFAHGSASSRHSTRNNYVAEVLNSAGFATLLVDLLRSEEKAADMVGRHLRYNVELLARRFGEITKWLLQEPVTKNSKIGYFGSSAGGAATILAASHSSDFDIVIPRKLSAPNNSENAIGARMQDGSVYPDSRL